jgi:hypothetical protein
VDHDIRLKSQDSFIVNVKIASYSVLTKGFRRIITVTGHSHDTVTKTQDEEDFGDARSQRDDTSRWHMLLYDGGTRRLGDTVIRTGDLENEDH